MQIMQFTDGRWQLAQAHAGETTCGLSASAHGSTCARSLGHRGDHLDSDEREIRLSRTPSLQNFNLY